MQAARCAVIVLAGGKSTRLGRDKASEVLAGKTLLQRAVDACEAIASRFVIVKARDQRLPEVASDAPIGIVEDVYRETGPLGGIYTGLNALAADADDVALVVACDMPLLQPALLQELIRRIPGHDAVTPVRDGLPEPLCAVYTTNCLEPARELLDRGAYKLSGLLDEVDTLNVPEDEWRRVDPNGLSFLNVNREEDLEQVRRLIEASRGSDSTTSECGDS